MADHATLTTQPDQEVERDEQLALVPRVPVGAHLVGSVPLGGVEEVFRRTAAALGSRLRRLPDGEPGPRADWILWQYPVFSALPQFEVGPPGGDTYRTLPKLRLRGLMAIPEPAEDVPAQRARQRLHLAGRHPALAGLAADIDLQAHVQRRQIDAAHVAVHPDHRRQPG